MERFTISSTTPQLVGVPGLPPSVAFQLQSQGDTPFELARESAAEVARRVGVGVAEALPWIETARIVTLRGIGTANTERLARLGITDLAALARQDPDSLAARLRALDGSDRSRRVTPAETRVWVSAADAAVERAQ
jgi:Domain of unknown function (DUF4332)